MIGALAIVAGALVTALLTGIVAWKWRGQVVPVGWLVFVMMMLGSLSIGAFYLGIAKTMYSGGDTLELVPFSRALFWFILIATSLMALGVLILGNGGDGENG